MPDYEDIFIDNDPTEQWFIADIMIENLKQKTELEGEHIKITIRTCFLFISVLPLGSYGYNK